MARSRAKPTVRTGRHRRGRRPALSGPWLGATVAFSLIAVAALGFGIWHGQQPVLLEEPHLSPCSARMPLAQSLAPIGHKKPGQDWREALVDWHLSHEAGITQQLSTGMVGNPAEHGIGLYAGENPSLQGLSFASHFPIPADMHITTGCVRYRLFIPQESITSMRRLPGLYAGETPPVDCAQTRGSRPESLWLDLQVSTDSQLNIRLVQQPADSTLNCQSTLLGSVSLPRGEWVTLEQETQLGSASDQKGWVRIWLNGKPVMEAQKLALRSSPSTVIAGMALVHPADKPEAAAPTAPYAISEPSLWGINSLSESREADEGARK